MWPYRVQVGIKNPWYYLCGSIQVPVNHFQSIVFILTARFKANILILKTCLLLRRSFGNVIHNIAANSEGLLSARDIRNLEKCYNKRNKTLLDLSAFINTLTFSRNM